MATNSLGISTSFKHGPNGPRRMAHSDGRIKEDKSGEWCYFVPHERYFKQRLTSKGWTPQMNMRNVDMLPMNEERIKKVQLRARAVA